MEGKEEYDVFLKVAVYFGTPTLSVVSWLRENIAAVNT